MNDNSRARVIATIKLKARHQRFGLRHDPEPSTPDLMQTVRVSELSLLIDGVRR